MKQWPYPGEVLILVVYPETRSAAVGAVDEVTIKAYIENQRWDEDDESFKITEPTKP